MSPLALVRGRQFERTVLADDARVLGKLVGEHFGVSAHPLRVLDIGAPVASATAESTPLELLRLRAADTRREVDALLRVAVPSSVVVHPVLTMTMPGSRSPVFLEPDALALVADEDGRLVCVEVKSRPTIDGVADPATAGAAARQVAVYVHALRDLLADLGHDPARVSTGALLITPWNATNIAVGHVFDVGKRLGSLARQLARVARIDGILDLLPDGFTLDFDAIVQTLSPDAPEPVRAATVAAHIRRLPANYVPGCRSHCQMSEFCHHDAISTGDPALLGTGVRDHLAGMADLHAAARLARNASAAPPDGLTDDEQAVLYAALADQAARAAVQDTA
ncbi:hypothetical protein AB0J83_03360 [Actinoplanes sp. NPDC049596]|uniref:hypothetical protein n=1 Tax=unclassified Actinoplanes TaxID=2626549 RepID=UPI003442F4EC